MENTDPTTTAFSSIEFTPASTGYLETTRKWALFLAILGFIGIGFMIIGGIIMTGASSMIPGLPFKGGAVVLIVFLLMALLYFFPVFYLFKFASISKEAVAQADKNRLEEAMMYLKKYYKFIGILIIVILCLYLVGMIVGGLGAAFSGL
ncbi:MAG: hypothetical protein RBS37_10835 [Bacteroidales bacterium]|jgi:hypothetical protein|nr:hypothetical protein [Bacteroidales bacterium]